MTVYKRIKDLPETNYPFRIMGFKLMGCVISKRNNRFPIYLFTIRYYTGDEMEIDNDYWAVLELDPDFPVKTNMRIVMITDDIRDIVDRYHQVKII